MLATKTRFRQFPETAQLVSDLVVTASRDPKIREAALEITSPARSGEWMNEARLLFEFVRDNVRYTGDPAGEDVFQYPLLTLSNLAGDCNNRVILLASLARSIGFPVRIVYVFRHPIDQVDLVHDFPEHVFLEVDVTKDDYGIPRWIPMETTPAPNPLTREPTHFLAFGQKFPGGNTVALPVPLARG